LGRRHVADAMAEKYFSESPYSYAGNDPINKYDVLGLKYYWKREEWQQESHFDGGIMDFINNLNNHLYSYGNSSSASGTLLGDYKLYMSSTTKVQRRKMSFLLWDYKTTTAAWKAGFSSRQEVLRRGYTMKAKYRRKIETLSFIYSGYDENDLRNIEQSLSEVQVIYELYYELGDVWFGNIETGEENSMFANVNTTKRKMNHKETLKYIDREFNNNSNSSTYLSLGSIPSGIGAGTISLTGGAGVTISLGYQAYITSKAAADFFELYALYDKKGGNNGLYMVTKEIHISAPGAPVPTGTQIISTFYTPSGKLFFTIYH
ncbi:MAG: hypothetical protein GXO80_03740, partial [Chlorobi bacterium]|nr:hypothetical protein [Chlorobiota bacterium]